MPAIAHSARAIVTSMASLGGGASVSDICKAATWSSTHVFAKHYKLDVALRGYSIPGRFIRNNIWISLDSG